METRDYVLRMPPDTGRAAACHEVGCESWRHGWDTALDERTPQGRDAAAWIRSGGSGRAWRELPGGTGEGLTVFRFEAGQRCFAEHRTRPASWLVRSGAQVARRADMREWIDDLDEHVGRLADQALRG